MSSQVALDQRWIEHELRHVEGLQLRFEGTVDSTNTWVLDERRGIAPGTVLFAEAQAAGRGRRGRQWHSPQSQNVYATLAWSWSAPLERLGGLSSAVGVGLVEALHALGARDLALKWPNDVLANDHKLAGILIESGMYGDGTTRLAIGVGVNVLVPATTAPESEISQPWTSLGALVSEAVSRDQAAAAVARALHQTLMRFEQLGWAGFAEAWRRYDCLRGRMVQTSGATALAGVAAGVDASGALLLDIDGVIQQVHAGEVSVRPMAPKA